MPQNTYLKQKKYIRAAVAALQRDAVLPMAFTMYDGKGFVGAEDDTVTWKTEGITRARDYEWRTRNQPIVMDLIARTSVSITLDTHTTSAVPVTDEESTLDLVDYGTEILTPMVNAVNLKLENDVARKLKALPFKHTDLTLAEADSPFKALLGIKGVLDQQGTPIGGRKLIAGTNVFNWLMTAEEMVKYDPSQALTAYRAATFGKLANFEVVDGGSHIGVNDFYAVHSTAMVIANLAPAVDPGVVWGERFRQNNWSLRLVRDMDPAFARGRNLLSTFTGISSVNDEYQRHTSGPDEGHIIIEDGKPLLTDKNVRGARGVFTPA